MSNARNNEVCPTLQKYFDAQQEAVLARFKFLKEGGAEIEQAAKAKEQAEENQFIKEYGYLVTDLQKRLSAEILQGLVQDKARAMLMGRAAEALKGNSLNSVLDVRNLDKAERATLEQLKREVVAEAKELMKPVANAEAYKLALHGTKVMVRLNTLRRALNKAEETFKKACMQLTEHMKVGGTDNPFNTIQLKNDYIDLEREVFDLTQELSYLRHYGEIRTNKSQLRSVIEPSPEAKATFDAAMPSKHAHREMQLERAGGRGNSLGRGNVKAGAGRYFSNLRIDKAYLDGTSGDVRKFIQEDELSTDLGSSRATRAKEAAAIQAAQPVEIDQHEHDTLELIHEALKGLSAYEQALAQCMFKTKGFDERSLAMEFKRTRYQIGKDKVAVKDKLKQMTHLAEKAVDRFLSL